jgi:hypothetical protein
MGTNFDFHISLRVTHPDIDPELVSNALSMKPKFSWKVGTPRVTPKGNSLGGTRTDSYCSFEIGQGSDGEVAKCISDALERLTPHSEFLSKLRTTGGSLMFYIFWYPNGDTGDVFRSDVLAKMASLGIDLGLNVYDDRKRDEL